ncbi:hypothetical protein ACR3K2_31480 [Cryptosporidium serpentis]
MSLLKYMGNFIISCLFYLAYVNSSKIYSNSLRTNYPIPISGHVSADNTKRGINCTIPGGIGSFYNFVKLNGDNVATLSQCLTDIHTNNNNVSILSKSNEDISSNNTVVSLDKERSQVSKDFVTIMEDFMNTSENSVEILKDSINILNDSINVSNDYIDNMSDNSTRIPEDSVENLDFINIEELVAVPELMQYGCKLRRKIPVTKSIRPVRPRRRTRGRKPSSYPETVTFISEENFVEMWEPYWDYELFDCILNKKKS